MANDRLDIVVFGATGYTGKYAVKATARFCKEQNFKFGIAGRRKEALEAVIKELEIDFEVPIILADVKDEESLKKMTGQAKVIVNCCGPYRFYGEPVVKACIATGTHQVDVTGEPEYMEKMAIEYHEAAQNAGVYIVSACGFDSIPADLGVIFAQQNFEGEINSIEMYYNMNQGASSNGAFLNYGTWETAVHSVSNASELREIRRKLYPTKLPEFKPKLKTRGLVHKSDLSLGWSTLFPGSDRSVALRSQRFLYEKYKQRPAQVQTYVTFKSFRAIVSLMFFGIIFGLMTRTRWGCKLLLRYPAIFSAGYVTPEGPKPQDMEKVTFSITFKSLGWSEKVAEPTDKHTDPPNKQLITKVSGVNPSYGMTTVTLVLSAVTILKEADKMPDNGGVLSPGAAFAKTSLIEQLKKNDVKFEVVSSSDIKSY